MAKSGQSTRGSTSSQAPGAPAGALPSTSAALPLVSDLAGLLVEYARHHGIPNDDPLVRALHGYGQRKLTMANWLAHLDELAERTNTPEIGLVLGQQVQAAHGGVLAYLVLNCDNLAYALKQFERYQRILYGGEGDIAFRGDTVRVSYQQHDIDTSRSDEVLFSGIIKFVRDITGRHELFPTEVGFLHEAPAYAAVARDIFGPGVRFGCDELYVEFPLQFLMLPIARSDGALQKILQLQAESLLSVFTVQDAFEQQLQQGMVDMLKEGLTGIGDLAQRLGLAERTLQRRLQERGMNFTDILKQTRKEMAGTYLKDSSLSLTEIGFLLAYSEQSAFTRAFKQWYGQSPSAYRKAQG